MFNLQKFKENKFLYISIVIYIVVFSVISVLQHSHFKTQAWDMGIFDQSMWNTVHGRFMENSIEEIPNHFGVHMSPFLLL